jgi:hypothetical protein
MNNKIEEQPFEFVLYINKHIICQRYFSIRDYNEKVLKSLELKELMDRLVGVNNGKFGNMGLIPSQLKSKSVDYLWRNYNPYLSKKEDTTKIPSDREDMFEFEIRVNKEPVAQSCFSGNLFPPQVRYQVDIKEIIPSIISEIKYTFSQKNYTTKYGDVKL